MCEHNESLPQKEAAKSKHRETYSFLPTDTYAGVREIYTSLGIIVEATSSLEADQQIFALRICRPEGETCGIASGIYHAPKKGFQILKLYLRREERTKEHVLEALRELLSRARERFHPDRYEWMYQQREEGRDPYLSLVKGLGLSWLSPAVRRHAGIVMKLSTAVLRDDGMKHNHYCLPEYAARMGYAFLPWKTCGEAIKDEIRALLASPGENTEGLSPFIGDAYDPATSFVLTHEGKVCGWVICAKAGDDGVEIRRWYIAHAGRRRLAGQFLGAHMLRIIQAQCQTVYFTVLDHSKSMQRFAKGYLGGAILEEANLYRLEMSSHRQSGSSVA